MSVANRPKTSDYQRYLASREWAVLREKVRERSGNRCEHCFNASQQAVHHLTYERLNHEDLADLLAVCNECHEFLSGKSNINPLSWWAVVTPRLLVPGCVPRHLLIPFNIRDVIEEDCERVGVIRCRDDICLWCGYADDNWPMFVSKLWYIEDTRQ